eukprot:TRINITY_DN10114_c0_g1_i7.p1 TRINITY_DN10114_c0_g1~~TRINITY_DN10114_c0_g1_i7.p1  ORF type:complete len:211 (-),score=33.36 TRINITY_DN10114_c0_g1_i7:239-871(-)
MVQDREYANGRESMGCSYRRLFTSACWSSVSSLISGSSQFSFSLPFSRQTLLISVDLRFVEGDAQNLPLPDESVDQYTIAFGAPPGLTPLRRTRAPRFPSGIRNVTDIPAALREAHRVLRRGGRFSCLEFSRVEAPIVGPVYRWYNATVLPVAGHVVAGDWAAYQYLAESIERFPDQETFRAMIADAGFHAATYSNYSLGIVAAHDGWKL